MPTSPLSIRSDDALGVAGVMQIATPITAAEMSKMIEGILYICDRKLMKAVHHKVTWDESSTLLRETEPETVPDDIEVVWQTSARARYVHVAVRYQASGRKVTPPSISVELVRHADSVEIDPGCSLTVQDTLVENAGLGYWASPTAHTGWEPAPGPTPVVSAGPRPLTLLDQQDTAVRLIVSAVNARVLDVHVHEFGGRIEAPTFVPIGGVV